MSNFITVVPKLLGRENYSDWTFDVENYLILEGLWKCVLGTETDDDINAKAKAKLVLTLDPALYIHVKEAKNTKEIWEILKKMYDDSGFSRRITLLKNLISIRLENCDSMANYINQIIETSQKLRGTGFQIVNEWIGSLLLAGLPDKLFPMIMAIEHSGISISAHAIKTKLLDMTEDGRSSSGSAFVVKVEETTINLGCVKTELNEEEFDFVNNDVAVESTIKTEEGIIEVRSIISTNTEQFCKRKRKRRSNWTSRKGKYSKKPRCNISVNVEETTINLECVQAELNEEVFDFVNSDITVASTIKTEEEIIEEVRSIISTKIEKFYCNKCGGGYEGYCPKCSTLTHILNKIAPFQNSASILEARSGIIRSKVLEIRNVGMRKGVFALDTIPKNVTFGPANGLSPIEDANGHMWRIKDKKFANSENCNWMKYVDSAADVSAKNLNILQNENNLYFRTDRRINKDEELLIYYDEANMQKLSDREFKFTPLEEEKFAQIFACTLCCLGFGLDTCLIEHKSKCPYAEPHSNFEDLEIIECHCCKIWLEKQEHLKYHMTYCWENYHRVCSSSSRNFKLTDIEGIIETRANDVLPIFYDNDSCSNNEVCSVAIADLDNNVTNLSNREVHENDMTAAAAPITDNIDVTSISDNIRYSLNSDICANDKLAIVGDNGTFLHIEIPANNDVSIRDYNNIPYFFKMKTDANEVTPKLNMNCSSDFVASLTTELKCGVCLYDANDFPDLKQHICNKLNNYKDSLAIRGIYGCPECSYSTNNFKYLWQHFHQHVGVKPNKKYNNCWMCSFQANSEDDLKLHLSKHTTIKRQPSKEYKCTYCFFETNHKHILLLHLGVHRRFPIHYECDFCIKVFDSPHEMENHSKIGHEVKIGEKCYYKCLQCPLHTLDRRYLKNHKYTHSDFKPFKCGICEKMFIQKNYLELHIKTKHSENKEMDYKCTHCNYQTNYKQAFQRHLLVHTDSKTFPCCICESVFYQKCNLVNHMNTKHCDATETPYKCQECSYRTKYKSNLTNHMSTHSDIKSFHCDICKKEFRLKSNLIRHTKYKHLVGEEGSKQDYKCTHCSYQTHRKMGLQQHLKTHTKPCLCEICGKNFALKTLLKLHVANQHVENN